METDVTIVCADGYRLTARHLAPARAADVQGGVVIAPATGVPARYYGRYAQHLAARGLHVLVPDYRGIGRSAPPGGAGGLRRLRVRWHEWGSLDLDACIAWMWERMPPHARLSLVGHSFGGVAAAFTPHSRHLDRMLLVGAQRGYWRDYARGRRLGLIWRWHVVMPILTLVFGCFPGRRLRWLEDLPRGVALDWAWGRADYAKTIGDAAPALLGHAAEITADVLVVNPTDDPFATTAAVRRTLSLLPNARTCEWRVAPAELHTAHIGHFGLFHQRFAQTFWERSADWLTAERSTSCGVAGAGIRSVVCDHPKKRTHPDERRPRS